MIDTDNRELSEEAGLHLEIIRRAVRFLETELLSHAPKGSFAYIESRIAAEDAMESLRALELSLSQHQAGNLLAEPRNIRLT